MGKSKITYLPRLVTVLCEWPLSRSLDYTYRERKSFSWASDVPWRASNIYIHFESTKGQLISKCLFGVFNFFQKRNESKSTEGIRVEKSIFTRSFFGRNVNLKKKIFRLCQTFSTQWIEFLSEWVFLFSIKYPFSQDIH